jgi:hypothetical protein
VKQWNPPAEVTYCKCDVPQESTSVPLLTPPYNPWGESRERSDKVICDMGRKLDAFGSYAANTSGRVQCEGEKEPNLISYKMFEQIILQSVSCKCVPCSGRGEEEEFEWSGSAHVPRNKSSTTLLNQIYRITIKLIDTFNVVLKRNY